jgi:hypothetical protein
VSHRFRFTARLQIGEDIIIDGWEKVTEEFKKNGKIDYYYLHLKDEKDRYTTSKNIAEQLSKLHCPAHVLVVKDGSAMSLKVLE